MKLSIITINLNNSAGLKRTIESVISQTFTDYEYVIVDGASTDGSVDVIKCYQDKITYWVTEPDKGIYNAMNKGTLQAKGEYCLFLNSGDVLVDNNILSLVFQKDIKEDLICCKIEGQDQNNGLFFKKSSNEITFYDFYYKSLSHPSTFIKRTLFEQVGLYEEKYKIISDWYFFLMSIVRYNASYYFLDIVVSSMQPDGLSTTLYDTMQEERQHILENEFSCFLNDYSELSIYRNSRFLTRLSRSLLYINQKRSRLKKR